MTGDQPHCRPKPLCLATDPDSVRLRLSGGPLGGVTVIVEARVEHAGALALVGGFYVRDGRNWEWCATADRSGTVEPAPTPRRQR